FLPSRVSTRARASPLSPARRRRPLRLFHPSRLSTRARTPPASPARRRRQLRLFHPSRSLTRLRTPPASAARRRRQLRLCCTRDHRSGQATFTVGRWVAGCLSTTTRQP